MPPAKVVEELQWAHIKLHPSVTSSNGDEEGIPNSLKEAMACGLPVVSTHHSGIPELVEDGVSGYLVPERDASAIADALRVLMQNSEAWEAMGRAGRAAVERDYGAERLHRELSDLYRRLMTPAASTKAVIMPERAAARAPFQKVS